VRHAVQHGICSAFARDQGKLQNTLIELVAGPSGRKLTSSQQSGIKYTSPKIKPYLCCFFTSPPSTSFFSPSLSVKTFTSCFYKHFYVCIIWISNKPCITPTEGMNTHAQICLQIYIFLYGDALIIGRLGSPV
jgi:hypothetical protein